MRIRFSFSLKTTLICAILMVGMIRASIWQWDRHQQKEQTVAELAERLQEPISPIEKLADLPPASIQYRRVSISGEYDFNEEVILRNRKHPDEGPGVHVLTPLKVNGFKKRLLVDRGFVPFNEKSATKRKKYQKPLPESAIALIKPQSKKRTFQPSDTAKNGKRIDAWLRVDLTHIQIQLPYELLPFYVEIMSDPDPDAAINNVVSNSSGREDIFFATKQAREVSTGEAKPDVSYPIPAHSTLIPSATHLAYVFEWAIMAVFTFLIGIVLQLKRH